MTHSYAAVGPDDPISAEDLATRRGVADLAADVASNPRPDDPTADVATVPRAPVVPAGAAVHVKAAIVDALIRLPLPTACRLAAVVHRIWPAFRGA